METIQSLKNPKIKQAVRLMSSAKARREDGLFVLEGLRLCMDVVRTGLRAQSLFMTESEYERNKEDLDRLSEVSEETFIISESVSEKLSDTRNPQGVYCVLRTLDKQDSGNKIEATWTGKKLLLLENVQDPANLGAVSRTAEALGIDGLIVSGGCDITGPKALRASMGALLRIPVYLTDDVKKTIQTAKENGFKTYASTPDSGAVKITDADFCGCVLCVVGNEANGVTEEVQRCCMERITIPMAGRAESLNAGAAASILMWEMVKPDEKTELLDLDAEGIRNKC